MRANASSRARIFSSTPNPKSRARCGAGVVEEWSDGAMNSTTPALQRSNTPTLIERIIELSARNKFLVFIFTIFAVAAGIYGLTHTPLDAIPDLSDVQVIVYTEWEGRSPDLVEDQITYPISSVFIAAPKVKFVRGESMFGKSFI